MDLELFNQACKRIIKFDQRILGIGTLGEKTLHAVLKHYCEIDESKHEIKVGRFYADIFKDNKIIEIQTRQFDKLRKKLDSFLSTYSVTIVYPMANRKYLSWINPTTGEVSKQRLSPKRANIYEVFDELYKIKQYLINPNLKFSLVLIDMEEYRILNGWSDDKKKGSRRADRIPTSLAAQIEINDIKDYSKLIPFDLPYQFTSKDYAKAANINLHKAQTALNVLTYVNAVERVGKDGNNIIYITK